MFKVCVIFSVSVISLVLNYFLVLSTNSEAWVSEVTQYGNIQRCISVLEADETSTIIVGSSISGRLLPTYFDGGCTYNLGVDSGSTTACLEYLKSNNVVPEKLIVELNRLDLEGYHDNVDKMVSLFGERDAISFRLRMLQPNYRPSSVLYQYIKVLVDRGIHKKSVTNDVNCRYESSAAIGVSVDLLIVDLLEHFAEQGVEIIFIDIPSKVIPSVDVQEMAKNWELNNRAIFINREVQGVKLSFSDDIHMTLESARAYVRKVL